jgi:hypothetical protein
MAFSPDLSAQAVHEQLVSSVSAFKQAEQAVVVWFAEMNRRGLYRELGYSSMRQYAVEALGFSETRAGDFLRLAGRLEELPQIRAAVESGQLGYTKARELVGVASPQTEGQWLQEALGSSRRELEQKAAKVRRKARVRRAARQTAQAELLPADASAEDALADAVPSTISLRLTAEQRARYDALWQQLGRAPNAEDLLAALAVLAGTENDTTVCENDSCSTTSPRGMPPPVQIHVQQCPDCGTMTAGGRPLDRADAARMQCDAVISAPGQRNTATIPPRTRQDVLARDGHRCQGPGCNHRLFLAIHHMVPREQGGSNRPDNLITLCSACHRLWHKRGWAAPAQQPGEQPPPPP